jgi:hypothetical protein
MSNKYLEKIATEYTDKQHARRHAFLGLLSPLTKGVRKHDDPGGWARTQGRTWLEGKAGGIGGTLAGQAVGGAVGRGNPRAQLIGLGVGKVVGTLTGSYHGALSSVRNRIAEGKLKGVKNTSKK